MLLPHNALALCAVAAGEELKTDLLNIANENTTPATDDHLKPDQSGNSTHPPSHSGDSTHPPSQSVLPDSDSSVVLVKSSSLDDPNASKKESVKLSESQDSGIGTLTKTEATQIVDDSPEMTSDSGISAEAADNDGAVRQSESATTALPDEIQIDQNNVVYVDPTSQLASTPPVAPSAGHEENVAPAAPSAGHEDSVAPVHHEAEKPKPGTTLIIEKPKLSHDIQAALANVDKAEPKKAIKVRAVSTLEQSDDKEKQYSKFMSYVESAQMKSGAVPLATATPGDDADDDAKNPTSFYVDMDDGRQFLDAPISSKSIESLMVYKDIQRRESLNRERERISMASAAEKLPSDRVTSPDAGSKQKGFPFTLTTMEYKAERDGFKDGDVDSDGFRVPSGVPPSSSRRTSAQKERAAMLKASSLRDVYSQPFGSLREAFGKNTHRVASPTSSNSSDRRSLSPTTSLQHPPFSPTPSQSSVMTSYRSDYTTTNRDSTGYNRSSPSRRSGEAATTDAAAVPSNKRAARTKGAFIGPRPWGARHSEPSVRDVRAALAIHQAKESARQDVGGGGKVRDEVSRIGFSPDTQHESQSYLEEKSISLLASPAGEKSANKGASRLSAASASGGRGASAALSLRAESMENLADTPPRLSSRRFAKSTENVFEAASRDKAATTAASKRSLQTQYADLQAQFSRWQTQLMDNQSLISSKPPEPHVTSSKTVTLSTAGAGGATSSSTAKGDKKPHTNITVTNSSPLKSTPQRKVTSEFNRRATIDVGDARKCLLEEIERRGRMFDKYTVTTETRQQSAAAARNTGATNQVCFLLMLNRLKFLKLIAYCVL